MKPIAWVGLGVAVVGLIGALMVIPKVVPAQPSVWEYKIDLLVGEEMLNLGGAQGWEVAATFNKAGRIYVIFKRKKPPVKSKE